MPRVSFVIPSRNCAAWLHFAVNSALTQSFKDLEVIVIDDGSTDTTKTYLDYIKTKDDRIRVFTTQGIGRSEARNLGNQEALGEYIFVLDADDRAYPRRVEYSLKALENGIDYVYGSLVMVDAMGSPRKTLIASPFDLQKTLDHPRMESGIAHSSVAYSKDLALKYPYRSGEISKQGIDDWCMQMELAHAGKKLDFVPNDLGEYRVLSTAISSTRVFSEVLEAKRGFIEMIRSGVPA